MLCQATCPCICGIRQDTSQQGCTLPVSYTHLVGEAVGEHPPHAFVGQKTAHSGDLPLYRFRLKKPLLLRGPLVGVRPFSYTHLDVYKRQARARGTKIYHLNIGQPYLPSPKEGLESLKHIDRKVLEYSRCV